MKMIAIRMGFYKGDRIRPGAEFDFNENELVQSRDAKGKPAFADGKPVMVKVRVPKWAMPASNAAEAKKAIAKANAPTNGDTKPSAAAAVAKQKNAEASEASGLV